MGKTGRPTQAKMSSGEERSLAALREFAKDGRTPTVRELADVVGVGVSTAFYFMGRLRARGLVLHEAERTWARTSVPLPLVMYCPAGHLHVDEGKWATKPHKTHQCQFQIEEDCSEGCHEGKKCGLEWRPAKFPTVGVAP